jgi:chemotaxis protein methyltransferase CheR
VIKLSRDEQKALTQYIYEISGIALDESKAYLIEGRLGTLAEDLSCRSFADFLARAQTDVGGSIKRRVIDAITTGETLFFRDSAPFDLLRHKILPELIDRRGRAGARVPIRIWSAACSTGQEVYSIAIVLKETLRDLNQYDVRLIGTDLSNQAVVRASRGAYSSLEISRGMSSDLLSKYFNRNGDQYQVRDELRGLATFRTINLLQDFSGLGRFDIIFCRNVAIYFNDRDRASLFGRLERALERDGSLLIGSMESLNNVCPQLEPRRHLRSVFYQPRGAPVRV